MSKRSGKDANRVLGIVDQFLWLVILTPVLAVSGWSLWWVATHIGVPSLVAACFSACFDGAALLAARYSLKYAERGLSGTFPRTVTRVWAGLAAFVQTLHATLGGEPKAAALVWGSLPITAVVIYEIHMRWVKREALARAGTIYPAALPGFGVLTWVMFPIRTWTAMRRVVGRRREAIVSAATERPALMAVIPPAVKEQKETPADTPTRPVVSAKITSISAHRPQAHIRAWAEERDMIKPGGRGPLPNRVKEQYYAETGREDREASGE